MLCSATFHKFGSLVVFLFLWRGGGGGLPFATQSAVLDYQHWHPLGILLEMQSLRPHLQFPESGISF